jgi:alpha-ketoglutarate-dependent taurine dioxygenase
MNMNQIGKPSADLFADPVSAADPAGLVESVTQRLADNKAVLIEDFPTTDPARYIEFLRHFGRPLDNYGAGSGNDAYALHPNINVVRCAAAAGGRRVQEQGGPLPAHAARAFSKYRPRYIAMLMVTAGWPAPPGTAGESTIVRWSDALQHMRHASPATYDADHTLLAEIPITITAQYVTDEWSDLPLLYPLDDAASEDDIGARYSLALGDQLPTMAMDPQLSDRYAAAAARFAEAANHPAARYIHPLRLGQVILLDNNRFGHGRLPFPETRPADNGTEVNPRTLWSTVLA